MSSINIIEAALSFTCMHVSHSVLIYTHAYVHTGNDYTSQALITSVVGIQDQACSKRTAPVTLGDVMQTLCGQ